MPIVHTYPDKLTDNSPEELLKRQLLEKISSASSTLEQPDESTESISDIDVSSDEDSSSEKLVDVERKHNLSAYGSLVEKTRDIPLEKVLFSAEGCSLFDDLCLRIDVNQRYASVLPQWKDVAHLLEVDSLRTKWVETCVRPREGLTRAMLEMYMQDGGTLGDVLEALIQLECLDILESVRPKVEIFLEERSRRNDAVLPDSQIHEKFFSVMKTLILALGQADPCHDIQKYANGLKPVLKNRTSDINLIENHIRGKSEINSGRDMVTKPIEHQLLIQNGSTDSPNYSAPLGMIDSGHLYNSKIHINQLKHVQEDMGKSYFPQSSESNLDSSRKMTCRILLLFSQDGIDSATQAVAMAKTVVHEDVMVDMLRLNEVSLWYEVLINPEACCLKWCYEADYIIPVLTPKFLHEIHGEGLDDDDGLLPTSPILNRYMYTLARTQYTQASCKNLKVRPVIPQEVLREIRTSNAVKIDPLLNSSWVPLSQDRFIPRLKGMLNEYVRRINKSCENDS